MNRIAILFAVRQELAPAARFLSPSRVKTPALRHFPMFFGDVAGAEVLLVASGMGARRAEEAAGELLQVWSPDLLIMAGVAGALADDLQVGDLITAEGVATEDGLLTPSHTLQPVADPAPRRGTLLSLDRVLVTAEEKRQAMRQFTAASPLAIEMETAGMARAARKAGVPWAALRAVSDTAAESLPLDFNRLRDLDGDLPTSRVALAAMAQPRAIPGLIRLGRNTGIAATALAGFLHRWLQDRPL